jgi:hypothetical protein
MHDYDIVVGSVHGIRYSGWDCNISKMDFKQFPTEWVQNYLEAYFQETLRTVAEEDIDVINKVYNEEQKHYNQPLAVEKLPLENYYSAEEYHQDYLDKNPTGYCHLPLSLFKFAKEAKEEDLLSE